MAPEQAAWFAEVFDKAVANAHLLRDRRPLTKSALVAVAVAFTISACGGGSAHDEDSQPPPTTSSSTSTPAPSDATSADSGTDWSKKFAGQYGTRVFSDTATAGDFVQVEPWTDLTVECRAEVPDGVGESIGPYWYKVSGEVAEVGEIEGYASSDTFWDGGDRTDPVDEFSKDYDPRVQECADQPGSEAPTE